MCGIAGFVRGGGKADPGALRRMTDSLAHRGPDAEGFFLEDGVALGHKRLSIIDLEGGAQPMHYRGGALVLTFNGEIYNYLELRKELEGIGFDFATHSDSEVILAAYAAWGEDCVRRFNGMWAFALYDKANRRVFCSRDRLGEKPFFYCLHGETFVFGSEMKALFAYGVRKTIREEVLDAYLCFTFVPAPHTFFQDVWKLPPGCSLVFENGRLRTFPYWDVEFRSEEHARRDEAAIFREFEELFRDSVRLRMRSDVPFGAFLSGGLDSSCVVALMASLSAMPVKTCTIAFAEKPYDESRLSRLVAERFSTDHIERMVTREDASSLLERLAWHYDEPFGDSSALPTYIVSKIARERVAMTLTGDGGDEVLCGYPIHRAERFSGVYSRAPAPWRSLLVRGAFGVSRRLPKGTLKRKFFTAGKVLRAAGGDVVDRIEAQQGGFSRDERERLLGANKAIRPAREFIEEALKACADLDAFAKVNRWLTKVSLPDDMLCKVDRATMAHSLEARIPFLDHRLVELMAAVSAKVKMQGLTGKRVLRQTLGRNLPPELLQAPKRGFSAPLTEWFRGDGEDELKKAALRSTASGLIHRDAVEDVMRANASGDRYAGNALWSLGILSYTLA